MARKKPRIERLQYKTVLMVGEGYCEEAFLRHLRELYCARGCGVRITIRNARGKGPDNVIDTAIAHGANSQYDTLAALLDTDLPRSDRLNQRARSHHVQMIDSSPCLEGLLLTILDQKVPDDSSRCKALLHPQLGGNPTQRESYLPLFDRTVLDAARRRILSLNRLLRLFESGEV